MKKNILAIAIASAVATPVAFANAPTVYGQFNMAIDVLNANTAAAGWTSTEGHNVHHRNSRVGIKGSEDLGNGLKAIYQAEGTINMNGGGFEFDRNTFAGIAGSFGTVVMGRHDTPLRMIQPNDGFADSQYAGNNTSNFNGIRGNRLNAGNPPGANRSGEDRLNNVLAYISPSFNGIQFAVAGATVMSGNATGATKSAIDNAYSGSLSYGSKSDGIYAAVAGTVTQNTSSGAHDQNTNTRATLQWNKSGLLLNAMYNNLEVKSNAAGLAPANSYRDSGSSFTFGAAYKMGAFTPRAKVAMISYKERAGVTGTTDTKKDSMSYALGLDYALGKKTTTYVEYAQLDKWNRAVNATKVNNGNGTDLGVFSVGFLHKF